jgi:protoporphyrinogen oxidase
MPDRYDVIAGGGLAGLTAAYAFQLAGADGWTVVERELRPGGHARSLEIDGYTFDYGPHILFTTDAFIEQLIRDLLVENLHEQERQAFIYHHGHGTYTRFPFQAHLHGLPVKLVHECLADLVDAVAVRARGDFSPANYEEWMRGTFGDAISERLMIPYARKLWTVEPSTMDFDWIERRVPTPDVSRILLGALTDDVEQIGATASFWYPMRGGIEALPSALARRVKGLELGRTIDAIDIRKRVMRFADGDALEFDRLVLTTPLHELPRLLGGELPASIASACNSLAYQNILCVNLGVDRPQSSEMHWVYFYEDDFPFHRLSFPAAFSPHNVPEGKSSLSIEIAAPRGERVDAELMVSRTIEALRRAAIIGRDVDVELVDTQFISPAYVVYDLQHRRNVDMIVSWLADHRVWCAGRFGSWGYLNMDHAMRSGMAAAESILADG